MLVLRCLISFLWIVTLSTWRDFRISISLLNAFFWTIWMITTSASWSFSRLQAHSGGSWIFLWSVYPLSVRKVFQTFDNCRHSWFASLGQKCTCLFNFWIVILKLNVALSSVAGSICDSQRNGGSVSHRESFINCFAVKPCVASSAGLSLVLTYFYWLGALWSRSAELY